MAGRAISIDILANVQDALRGTGDVEKALSDVASTLEDLNRTGDDSTDKMSRGFRDISKEADRSADKVSDAFRGASRNMKRSLDDGVDGAKRGMSDLKDEANSTGREMAASFREPADALDAVQELAANALGGLGPAGAIAGGAAAVGIGLVTTALTDATSATEDLKQGITDMYKQAAEDGRTYIDETQIQAEATRLLFEERTRIQEESNRIGVDSITLARAYAGDQESINIAIERGSAILAEREAKDKENLETLGAKPQKVDLESEAIRQVLGLLETELGWHKENEAAAAAVAEMKRRANAEQLAQINKAKAAEQSRFDEAVARAMKPIKAKVVVEVDDSKWTKWSPAPKTGQVQGTWLQRQVLGP